MAKSTTASKTKKPAKTKTASAPAAKTKASKPAPAKAAAAKPTSKAPAAKKVKAAKLSKENMGDDAIAKRAYEIWVEQGCPDGREFDNWTQAERELRG